jgi:hypothetical protein
MLTLGIEGIIKSTHVSTLVCVTVKVAEPVLFFVKVSAVILACRVGTAGGTGAFDTNTGTVTSAKPTPLIVTLKKSSEIGEVNEI